MFTLQDGETRLYGAEPIFRDGDYVARKDAPIKNDWLKLGTYTIQVAGDHKEAVLHLKNPLDPDHKRTKM